MKCPLIARNRQLIIRIDNAEQKTASGVIIPKPTRFILPYGRILAISEDCGQLTFESSSEHDLTAKKRRSRWTVGDMVYFRTEHQETSYMMVAGVDYWAISEDEVVASIPMDTIPDGIGHDL